MMLNYVALLCTCSFRFYFFSFIPVIKIFVGEFADVVEFISYLMKLSMLNIRSIVICIIFAAGIVLAIIHTDWLMIIEWIFFVKDEK